MNEHQNNYSNRLDLRDDILSDEDEKVVESKLTKMNHEDIKAILSSVGVRARKASTIDLLVKYGADVNAVIDDFGNTALMQLFVPHSSKNKVYLVKPEIVEAFIKHGADINAKNNKGVTVFDYAKEKDDIKL